MKFKEFFYLLGVRPKPRTYGYQIHRFQLTGYGEVEYAQWLHPHETRKVLSTEVIRELSKYLSPGDAAIDIGAHSGDSSIPIALSVGKSGYVFALEPNPYVFPVLKKNSELNPEKTNIVPLMFAATSTDGDYEFEYSDAGFCNGGFHRGISKWKHGHAFKLPVEGRNLQDYIRQHFPDIISRIRYIKVDAEGNDLEVLKSLENLIAGQKPYVMAEVFKKTSYEQRLSLLQFFEQQGYRVHKVQNESNLTGERIGSQNLMEWRHFDVFCIPERP